MLDRFSCLHTQVEFEVAQPIDVSCRLNWQFAHVQVQNVKNSSNQAHPWFIISNNQKTGVNVVALVNRF